jgi:menaquinone reductase, multiheme cytochrome c subunit
MKLFVFPRWSNKAAQIAGVLSAVFPVYIVFLVWYGASPKTTDVGYMPKQPVPYSHALHAGELGLDCRYCHNTVDEAAVAAVPPTQTCMNCHSHIWTKAPELEPIRESYRTGKPVEWVKVHDLPDYVYFNHSAHVMHGVGCVTCHGRIDKMTEVRQVHTLSMGWCLDCHRNPAPNLRPLDKITDMNWKPPEDPQVYGAMLIKKNHVKTSTDCYTCHR